MTKKSEISVEAPREFLPLLEWHKKWHYKNQVDFVHALKDHWEVVFVAGNGTGKTRILYWNLICYALGLHPYQIAKPPLTIKVLMYDYEHGYGKIFTETCLQKQYMPDKSVIGPMLIESPNMVKKWPSRDDRTIYFHNKSTMFFQTYEQKKRQHSGTNFDILGCDEEPPYQAYDESKRGLRTAKGGGRILHAFTPPFDDADKNRGPSWTKFKLIDPFEKGEDPDVAVVRSSMADNPAITDEFIRKFCKGKTEEQIRIQVYGDYPTWGELIFPDFEDFLWNPDTKTGNLLPMDFEIDWRDHDLKFEMAVDWHGSKPCAIIWSLEYMTGPNKGDVVVFDELAPLEGKGKTISDVCTAIREIEGWHTIKIKRWGDPKMRDKNNALVSGFSPWSEFRHNGIYLTESWNRDPYVGYSIINDYLRGKGRANLNHPRLFIRENCKTLRYYMKNHYNVKKKNGLAEPDPKFSDYCVNLKYIMLPKARKLKKNMEKRNRTWPLTSHGGSPYGPYGGTYIEKHAYI